MSTVRVEGVSVVCDCGERIYFLSDGAEPGIYRIQHGERPEVVSPPIDGSRGERSFAWREQVHAYLEVSEEGLAK